MNQPKKYVLLVKSVLFYNGEMPHSLLYTKAKRSFTTRLSSTLIASLKTRQPSAMFKQHFPSFSRIPIHLDWQLVKRLLALNIHIKYNIKQYPVKPLKSQHSKSAEHRTYFVKTLITACRKSALHPPNCIST